MATLPLIIMLVSVGEELIASKSISFPSAEWVFMRLVLADIIVPIMVVFASVHVPSAVGVGAAPSSELLATLGLDVGQNGAAAVWLVLTGSLTAYKLLLMRSSVGDKEVSAQLCFRLFFVLSIILFLGAQHAALALPLILLATPCLIYTATCACPRGALSRYMGGTLVSPLFWGLSLVVCGRVSILNGLLHDTVEVSATNQHA
jgi:hypothetical protein